jgi:DeoR/GlpR family transcriptional regulator of sugar metabolism
MSHPPIRNVQLKGSRSVDRQEKILQLLVSQNTLSINELAQELDVSGWTVRRELNKMEEQQVVKRSHGIVTLIEAPENLSLLLETEIEQEIDPLNLAKRQIGQTAVRLLRCQRHIALSAGSTTTQVAHALKSCQNIKVMTNGLNIAMVLSRQADIELICTGGSVHGSYFTLTGPEAERALRAHFFDVAVIGVSGIAIKEGLTVNSQLNAFTLRIMIEQSRKIMVVADHSKLGEVRFAHLAPVEVADWLVTDVRPDPEFCTQLQLHGVELIVSSEIG